VRRYAFHCIKSLRYFFVIISIFSSKPFSLIAMTSSPLVFSIRLRATSLFFLIETTPVGRSNFISAE